MRSAGSAGFVLYFGSRGDDSKSKGPLIW